MPPDCRRHDVHNRVCGANFVKMNIIGSHAMDFSFGLREPGKNPEAAFFHFRMNFTPCDETSDLFPGTVRFFFRTEHVKPAGADAMDSFLRLFELELQCRNLFQFGREFG